MKEEKRQSTGNLSGSRQKCKVYDIQSFFGDLLQKEIIVCFSQKDRKSWEQVKEDRKLGLLFCLQQLKIR